MSDKRAENDDASLDANAREELFTLIGGLCDGTLNDQEQARLAEFMTDAEARSIYRRYINLHGTIRAYHAHAVDVDFEHLDSIETIASGHTNGDESAPENIAAMNTMSRINVWLKQPSAKDAQSERGAGASAKQNRWGLIAKTAAIVLSTAAVLLIVINLMLPTPVPPTPVAVLSDSQHAQWVDEHNRLVFIKPGKKLLPQTLRLTDGLAEVKFNNGAVVLLDAREKPVTFRVHSSAEAFLQLGKITARAEVESAKGFAVGVPGNQKVIDVSTAFGIVVDESGGSELLVIDGEVDVTQTADDGSTKTVRMKEGQATKLDQDQTPIIPVSELSGQFLTMLPERPGNKPLSGQPDVPEKRIGPFNTGKGLRVGQEDPNWRIVAARNLPGFKPQQAVVCMPLGNFRPNDPQGSQWLSTSAALAPLPVDAVLTVQTTFTLPKDEVKNGKLRIRFIADNALAGVRLNGNAVHVATKTELKSFVEFSTVVISRGFKVGENTLVFDVANASPAGGGANPLAIRVELDWMDD